MSTQVLVFSYMSNSFIVDDSAPILVIENVLADTYGADDLPVLEPGTVLSDSYQFEDTDSEYATDYFAADYTSGVPLVVLHFDKHFDQLVFGAYAIDYFAEDYSDLTSEGTQIMLVIGYTIQMYLQLNGNQEL